jgi:hypothetical protein
MPTVRFLLVQLVRWFLVIALALLALYLGGAAIANWWAADVPPHERDAHYRSLGNWLALSSLCCLALAILAGWLVRPRD